VNILGINCFAHDTAAALLVDGVPVAFVEEERFNREKHTKAFPDQAIEFCLRTGGITIDDVDVVAFAHRAGRDFARGAADALKRLPLSAKRLAAQAYIDARLWRKQARFVNRFGFRGKVVNVGHHDAHAASGFFASGFEEAAVLTVDRGGDSVSTTLGHGQGSRVRIIRELRNPHSLGEIYTAITGWLGFHPNADEGKVMGLAPYGSHVYGPDFRKMVRLRPDGLFRVDLRWFRYQLEAGPLSARFLKRYGPPRVPESPILPRHKDVAFGVQLLAEETGLHMARVLQAETGSKRLVLAGGVALNSVMNGTLLRESDFEDIFIQPAAGDAGNALGAALHVWHHQFGNPRSWRMDHAFLGPSWSDGDYKEALRSAGLSFREVTDAAVEAADLLASSKIVGWFQGRAEVGPRALGARSILADPRQADMKNIVNERVKHREGFRPFAPAVLDDRGHEYFVDYHPNPFMLLVLPIKDEKQAVIPAVTHVDGTGRLQSVGPEEFERRTGVGVVLNTSFNLRGEPIVNRPEEAVADFLGTGMDALFLGNYLVEKGTSGGSRIQGA
jgi:carbamoyltransferase